LTDIERLRADVAQLRLRLAEETDKHYREKLKAALANLERELYIRELWLLTGVRCPCCNRPGIIHAHRALCAICNKPFHYDPWDNKWNVHLPAYPDLARDYLGITGGPKQFVQILKGDTQTNVQETKRSKQRKRSSSVVQQGDFNFTGGNSETD
jgi:hypothetical protein